MDFARSVLFSFLIVYSTSGFADVEYITPGQREKLEIQFNQASFNPKTDSSRLQDSRWSCDMYGARTHMNIQRDLKLYLLSQKDGQWQNKGAQVVAAYKTDGSALVGVNGRFEDHVKITKDGMLVSRLMLSDPSKSVLAYSVCKTL